VIDTRQHPAHGRDLIERIRKITDKPISGDQHACHGDHFYGNPRSRRPGHHHCATATSRRHGEERASSTKRRLAFSSRSTSIPPSEDRVCPTSLSIAPERSSSRPSRRDHVSRPAQNPRRYAWFISARRALYVGGPFATTTVEHVVHAVMDGWIAMLNRIAARENVDVFLPGHGDVGKREDVLDEAKC